jgi:hypothetical protein
MIWAGFVLFLLKKHRMVLPLFTLLNLPCYNVAGCWSPADHVTLAFVFTRWERKNVNCLSILKCPRSINFKAVPSGGIWIPNALIALFPWVWFIMACSVSFLWAGQCSIIKGTYSIGSRFWNVRLPFTFLHIITGLYRTCWLARGRRLGGLSFEMPSPVLNSLNIWFAVAELSLRPCALDYLSGLTAFCDSTNVTVRCCETNSCGTRIVLP